MKFYKHIFIYSALAIFLWSCGNNEKKNVEPEKPNSEAKEKPTEETPTIAMLTEEEMKMVGITLGTYEMKELTATIKANGNLRVPNNSKAVVTSLYGGIIRRLSVQIGDYIRKGQVVATISNPDFIRLQEQYLTVNSRITFAEQEYRRQKELFDNDAGAKKNLQSSSTELNSLRTQRASIQRQLQLMGISPSKVNNGNLRDGLVIVSPISGYVSNVIAQIGSYVDIASPILDVIDNNSLHLDLQVFEKDLPKIKVGQVVHFYLTNNPEAEYDAKVYSIGSSFSNDNKTISVHCSVNGNKKGLIDGMNITGIVSLSNVTTPAVPNDAIVNADGKYYIFVQTDKKAEEHHEEESHKEDEETEHKEDTSNINFEKVEVLKGVSDMGYTAVTFVNEIPANAKIVVKGAFFVNAKLSNAGGHEH
ncbi:efflux RND transporter periplasmic adaptor subunit [Epilithonimonas vandammei]|uniref:Efflux RND transporter periplasmic adaptor subunit n=1 Tax=Epilithonimonas vandammei TaxID=2487072 RepID=A0A3G8YJ16_9FLAO|nr:efflux RND transporter periplasmic adaptor subunit [Epilithonimonas vandammei]AZI40996.1 efflux RND transporter periplasmic adaptor subunit [Epilithonimonas vandammei]